MSANAKDTGAMQQWTLDLKPMLPTMQFDNLTFRPVHRVTPSSLGFQHHLLSPSNDPHL